MKWLSLYARCSVGVTNKPLDKGALDTPQYIHYSIQLRQYLWEILSHSQKPNKTKHCKEKLHWTLKENEATTTLNYSPFKDCSCVGLRYGAAQGLLLSLKAVSREGEGGTT